MTHRDTNGVRTDIKLTVGIKSGNSNMPDYQSRDALPESLPRTGY
jgi:hypothetical protein